MSIVSKRLYNLRQNMNKYGISACIIPTSDPHLSEYIADCFKYREYFSGFDGSNGTLFVTLEKAFLLTDGRYFLQAENQLKDTSIKLIKSGIPGEPDIYELCESTLKQGDSIFIEPCFVSSNTFDKIVDRLSKKGISIVTDNNPVTISSALPAQAFEDIYELRTELCGFNRVEKLKIIREKISSAGADGLILTALDDIAWIYNLRGNDVKYTPVFYGYSYITADKAFLFVDPHAIKSISKTLIADKVELSDYTMFYKFLSKVSEKRIIVDKNYANAKVIHSLPSGTSIISSDNPVPSLKAIKNDIEIENMRKAHILDGIALVKFMRYIKSQRDNYTTEISASDKLLEFRKENRLFNSNSFETIAAYGDNAAIIHYAPTAETCKKLEAKGALLVDSGGQYDGGTTDVTRMFILGETSEKFKRDYTLVCKAMLKLQNMHFPLGAKSAVLDGIVRESLWHYGIDFRHGTGHGIGYMLSVHEGPNRISFKDTSSEILPGSITSDEPGIYIDGEYGIRMENALLCITDAETEYGKFCKFEPLTLCPIDIDAIDVSVLTDEDVRNINEYHTLVYNKLSPFMTGEDAKYLEAVTRQI